MAPPKSIDVNPQLRALLDRALFQPNGLQVKMEEKAAYKARFQIYELRDRERKQSIKFYPPDDPNYASSPWETLSISIVKIEGEEGLVFLRIMPGSVTLEGLEITDPITGERLD